MKKAMIAMSGGVDSTAAVYLMKKAGYECIGVTMKLFDNSDINVSRERTCCCQSDIEDAKSAAYRLGIPHYTLNFTGCFADRVIKPFISAYENGATPNPCIECNRRVKFEALFSRAKELGCEKLVTGHYARIEKRNGKYILRKAADKSKDQSYVLYSMTQEQLADTVFPCGELTKPQIRDIVRGQGILNADKPDSQDICFVPNGDYAAFIEKYSEKEYPAGDFIDTDGNVIGRHNGIIRYTVGQRKGLGVFGSEPLYVCGIDPAANRITLGKKEDLFTRELKADNFNFIAEKPPSEKFRTKAKIRYRQTEQWAEVTVTGYRTVNIIFDEPQRAVTRGQAVVLYDGDIVIGGGTIL